MSAFATFRIGAISRFARTFIRAGKDLDKLKKKLEGLRKTINDNNQSMARYQQRLGAQAGATEYLQQRIGELTEANRKLATQEQEVMTAMKQRRLADFNMAVMDIGASIMYIGVMTQETTQAIVEWGNTFRTAFVDVYGGFARTGITADEMREKLITMSNRTGIAIDDLAGYMSKLAVAGLDAAQAQQVVEHAFIQSMGSSENMAGLVTKMTKEIRKLEGDQLPAYVNALSLTTEELDAYALVASTSEFQTMQLGMQIENLSGKLSEFVDGAMRNYNEGMLQMATFMTDEYIPVITDLSAAFIAQGPAVMQNAGAMLFFASMMKNAKMQGVGLGGAIMSLLPLLLALPGPLRILAGVAILAATAFAVYKVWSSAEHWAVGIAAMAAAFVGIAAIVTGGMSLGQSAQSFQAGGIVPGVGPRLAVVHGGEEVIPADETSRGMTFHIHNYGNEMDEMELGERISDILHRRAGF